MNHDVLSDVLSNIKNAERKGKKVCNVKYTNLVFDVLKIFQKKGYIKKVERLDDKFGTLSVQLKGRINECKSIRPRLSVGVDEIPKFVKRFLPGADAGFIIISTSKGVMTHKEAEEKNIGGRLIAYIY